MKCGRELKGTEVFCPECAAEMEKYPVKPGTPVQLPPRTFTPPVKKKIRRRVLKPEEQVSKLRHSVRWLSLALIVLILCFAAVTVMLLQMLEQRDILRENSIQVHTVSECFT